MVKNKLPLLDFVEKLFPDTNFKNTIVLACQHILETNYTMFEYLFEKGLNPKNTFLLGKCYSTSNKVLEKFRERGVFVHKGSTIYDSHNSFDEQFEEQVIDFLNKIKKMKLEKYDKVILVDDGGYLVYWANSILKDLKNIVAIEQTSAGYVKLKNLRLNFPIVNVARSKVKLEFESPFIAEATIRELEKHLSKLKINPKKILVIGKGAVGSNISSKLKDKFEVKHYDLDENLSDFKKTELSSIIGNFDLIIGCTGEAVIKPEYFNLLKKGVVLVSASSSDREFSASKLRKLDKRTKDCHKDVKVNGLFLLNSGFPINFNGTEHSVSPEKIQLTRALIFSAICLGETNNYPKSIIELDKNIQSKIEREFQKYN